MRSLTLDLIRHGETTAAGIYQGRTDTELTKAGEQQMRRALTLSIGWQRVLCSPLQRCQRPAADAAARLGLPIQVADWLAEYDFGDWDGRKLSAVYSEQPGSVEAFWRNPEAHPPPAGEPIDSFRQRILSGLDSLLAGHENHLLLVTHGGVIRALIAECLGVAPRQWSRLKLDHARFTRLNYYVDQDRVWPELVCCNTAQLPGSTL